jgi:hypothetical protein
MKTLDEIKNEVAVSKGYKNWNIMFNSWRASDSISLTEWTDRCFEVAELYASQYKSLEKEEEFIRLKEENNELTLSLQVANQGLDILYGVLERIKHEVDCNENMEFTSKLIDETLSVKEQ